MRGDIASCVFVQLSDGRRRLEFFGRVQDEHAVIAERNAGVLDPALLLSFVGRIERHDAGVAVRAFFLLLHVQKVLPVADLEAAVGASGCQKPDGKAVIFPFASVDVQKAALLAAHVGAEAPGVCDPEGGARCDVGRERERIRDGRVFFHCRHGCRRRLCRDRRQDLRAAGGRHGHRYPGQIVGDMPGGHRADALQRAADRVDPEGLRVVVGVRFCQDDRLAFYIRKKAPAHRIIEGELIFSVALLGHHAGQGIG